MKIAMISTINYPVPPLKYGGIEQVVYYLTEELVKRDHDVTLFAPIGSKSSAKLVADYYKYKNSPKGSLDEENVIQAGYFFSKIFKKAKEFDKKGKPNLIGLIDAIKKIDKIKRDDCQAWVEKNFTHERMVDEYEQVYYKILKKTRK